MKKGTIEGQKEWKIIKVADDFKAITNDDNDRIFSLRLQYQGYANIPKGYVFTAYM